MPVAVIDDHKEFLRLREGVTIGNGAAGLTLTHPWGSVAVSDPGGYLEPVLKALASGAHSRAVLVERAMAGSLAARGSPVSGPEPTAAAARLLLLLDRISPLLTWEWRHDDRPLLTVTPADPRARYRPVPARLDARPVRLSRFAYLRRAEHGMVAESPLVSYTIELSGVAARLAVSLGSPATVNELTGASGLPEPAVRAVVRGLLMTGVAEDAPSAASPSGSAGKEDPLRCWEFHDMVFHRFSRSGGHDRPLGATYRFGARHPSEPAVRPVPRGSQVPLPRPALTEILARDPVLTCALETRRSVRAYHDRPITLRELGEFLYRTARIRAVHAPDPAISLPYEVSDRPYPSAGACYDLDLYLAVHRCSELAGGAYYYDPSGHRLIGLSASQEHVDGLLSAARFSTGDIATPDVMFTFVSRVRRLSWKYSGIAYAAALKNVGVLLQTCYLVATAMRLAPCALGSGNSGLAAEAFGLDGSHEAPVGEFMLGRPAGPPPFRPVPGTWAAREGDDWPELAAGHWERATGAPGG